MAGFPVGCLCLNLGNALSVNRNRRLLLIACLVGLATAALLWLKRPHGPTYQGRDVEHWLRAEEGKSFGYSEGRPGYYLTPKVRTALDAMGEEAVPELVRLALTETGAWRRRIRNWLFDHFPSAKLRLSIWLGDWFNEGLVVPKLARSAVFELRPTADVLLPLLSHRLAESEAGPDAMLLLTAVRDRRNEAVQLLIPAVMSGDDYATELIGTFGDDGLVAIPALIECLKTGNGGAVEAAALCLGSFGTASSNALPLLRAVHERETMPGSRILLAVSAANIAPQDWALVEIRNTLTNANLRSMALEELGRAPNAAAHFESELKELASPSRLNLRAQPEVRGSPLEAIQKAAQPAP